MFIDCFNCLLHIASLEPFIKAGLELSASLDGCSVVYVNRLGNITAHELAPAVKDLIAGWEMPFYRSGGLLS
ncbi:hypothetical protein TSUD_96970 [Trifolium subterraneum]|nr:hypothetical protein TSUD_96970 [Trifolium subterraneum]